MDEHRRQVEAECGHDIHNHKRATSERNMETDEGDALGAEDTPQRLLLGQTNG